MSEDATSKDVSAEELSRLARWAQDVKDQVDAIQLWQRHREAVYAQVQDTIRLIETFLVSTMKEGKSAEEKQEIAQARLLDLMMRRGNGYTHGSVNVPVLRTTPLELVKSA
jgi:phosphoribosylanthranilate isomerase